MSTERHRAYHRALEEASHWQPVDWHETGLPPNTTTELGHPCIQLDGNLRIWFETLDGHVKDGTFQAERRDPTGADVAPWLTRQCRAAVNAERRRLVTHALLLPHDSPTWKADVLRIIGDELEASDTAQLREHLHALIDEVLSDG